MESSITLILPADPTNKRPHALQKKLDNLHESQFCPRIGPHKGWLTIPQKGCVVTNLQLTSGFSLSFTASNVEQDGNNFNVTMERLLISRNGVLHPEIRFDTVTEILVKNGWKDQMLATTC